MDADPPELRIDTAGPTASEDPFRHLPHLRDRIVTPEESYFRNLDNRRFEELAKTRGYPKGWRRPEAEREATRAEALAGRSGGDVWVFAYGSLMWDPAITFAEVRIGEVKGYQRRFCFRTEVGRGSPDNPGLMAGLEVGGSCAGLAFRIAHALVERETERLWRREMASWSYRPIWIDVATPQGPVEALTFLVNPASPNYFAHMDEDDSARLIASGTGHLGTCFAYLDNLADRLRALGLKDDAIFRLHAKAHALANGGGEGIAE